MFTILTYKCIISMIALLQVFLGTALLPVLAMNTTQDSYSLVSGHQSSQAPPIHIWHEDHILVEPPAGQRDVIVILAFISGASFVSLIIILSFFAFCR